MELRAVRLPCWNSTINSSWKSVWEVRAPETRPPQGRITVFYEQGLWCVGDWSKLLLCWRNLSSGDADHEFEDKINETFSFYWEGSKDLNGSEENEHFRSLILPKNVDRAVLFLQLLMLIWITNADAQCKCVLFPKLPTALGLSLKIHKHCQNRAGSPHLSKIFSLQAC